MTVIVGVRCTDGVVIGADSVATSAMGPMSLMQVASNDKIKIHQNSVISAASGSVGYSQRFQHHLDEAITGGIFRGRQKINDSITNISRRFITDLRSSHAQNHPHHGIGFTALLAVIITGNICLVEYDEVSFQPELKQDRLFYVSIGSGQSLADPFLAFVSRVLWHDAMPTVDEAKFGVHWTLQHTIRHAAGGIGGTPLIATLANKDNAWVASFMSQNDMQESSQYISGLEDYIGRFSRDSIQNAQSVPLPSPPSPASPGAE